MWILILIFVTVFCALKWIKWYISCTAMIYYMKKRGYRLPCDKDMKACTAFVARHLFK
jgi:hypothetical protein